MTTLNIELVLSNYREDDLVDVTEDDKEEVDFAVDVNICVRNRVRKRDKYDRKIGIFRYQCY
jgi:hypothetical protein